MRDVIKKAFAHQEANKQVNQHAADKKSVVVQPNINKPGVVRSQSAALQQPNALAAKAAQAAREREIQPVASRGK